MVYIPPWFDADSSRFSKPRAPILVYIPPWFDADENQQKTELPRNGFTFHLGSMQITGHHHSFSAIYTVYIPPWFDADNISKGQKKPFPDVYIPPWFDADGKTPDGIVKEVNVYIPPWFDADRSSRIARVV